MVHLPDVDIDFYDVEGALKAVDHIKASNIQNGKLVKHQSGIYLCNIPQYPIDNLASVPYKEAEKMGYQKIDFLVSHTYKDVKDEDHLEFLMNKEPLWDMLYDDDLIKLLPHIADHKYAIEKINPKNVMDLAIVIAIIRPAKRYLLSCSIEKIKEDIWKKADGYQFKKSHAVAYAMSIVVAMNLLLE